MTAPLPDNVLEIEKRHNLAVEDARYTALNWANYAHRDRATLLTAYKALAAQVAAAQAPRVDADLTWFWQIVDKYGPQGLPSDEREALSRLVEVYRTTPPSPSPTPAPTKGEVTRDEIRRVAWDFALPGFDGAMADKVMALLRDKGLVK